MGELLKITHIGDLNGGELAADIKVGELWSKITHLGDLNAESLRLPVRWVSYSGRYLTLEI